MRKRLDTAAIMIALSYFAISIIYIYYSDYFIFEITDDKPTLRLIQTYRGWSFVTITALLLYGVVSYLIGRLKRKIEAIQSLQSNLQQREHFLETLLNSYPDGFVNTYDKDYRITYLFGTEIDKYNIKPDFLIGKTLHEIYSPSLLEYYIPKIEVAFKGQNNTFQMQFMNDYYRVVATPLYDKDYNINEIMVVSQNINEIVEADSKFRNLFYKHSAVQYIIDPETMIFEDVNDAAVEFYGWTREEFKTFKLTDVCLMDEALFAKTLKDVQEDNISRLEFKHRLKSGEIRDVEIFVGIVPIHSKEYIFSIIQDITEKKKLYEELVLAKEKAELSNELIASFLRNISHEVRTPLNWIVGFSQLIIDEDLRREDRAQYANLIQKGSNRLIATVTNLVVLSEMHSGYLKPILKETSVYFLMVSIYEMNEVEAASKGLKISFDIEDIDYININTDSQLLMMCLDNIVNNAIKFTRKGSVEFGYELFEGYIEFFVKDTGIGIHSDYHEKIFDKFFQIDSSVTRGFEGTGIGLTIATEAITLLGGSIRVESEPGKGSTFYCRVKL